MANLENLKYVVFDRENYKTDEEFNKTLGTFIAILLKEGYECKVVYEGVFIYRVEFNYDPDVKDYGSDRLMWVTSDEEDQIALDRKAAEITEDTEIEEEEDL